MVKRVGYFELPCNDINVAIAGLELFIFKAIHCILGNHCRVIVMYLTGEKEKINT